MGMKGFAAGLMAAYFGLAAGGLYFARYLDTKEVHPKKQTEYFMLEDKLFGKDGLGDINKDNKISFDEKKNVYARMDIKPYSKPHWLTKVEEYHFPSPTFSQLEKAVDSYNLPEIKEVLPIPKPESFEPKGGIKE